jgi:hypothetical protein
MSSRHLPAEILDHIVNYLHDTEDVLRNCCLVSKSWVPHTRIHLFATVDFPTVEVLESWKKTFPDPSTSPAHCARTLSVGCLEVVTAGDAEAGGWITGFSCVVSLKVGTPRLGTGPPSSLVPFHGFSPALKSLHVGPTAVPLPRIFDLILSFPLLEDLTVVTSHDTSMADGDGSNWLLTATQPPAPLKLTGSLKLFLQGGMELATRRLLSLPGGIHLRKLTLPWVARISWQSEGWWWDVHILSSPSRLQNSLVRLFGTCFCTAGLLLFPGVSGSTSIDLSNATKLADVEFRLNPWSVEWIAKAL